MFWILLLNGTKIIQLDNAIGESEELFFKIGITGYDNDGSANGISIEQKKIKILYKFLLRKK